MTAHNGLYATLEGDLEAQAVLSVLGRGRDACKPLDALVEELGGTWNRRTVKRAIRRLREQGLPVATGNEGAWWTADPADLEEWLLHQKVLIEAMWATYKAVADTRQRMLDLRDVQQTTLFGEAA